MTVDYAEQIEILVGASTRRQFGRHRRNRGGQGCQGANASRGHDSVRAIACEIVGHGSVDGCPQTRRLFPSPSACDRGR